MSTQVFPTLSGLEWNSTRSEDWSGVTIQESQSGVRTAINNWSYPRYSWQLSIGVLPTSSALQNAPAVADFQALFGFFNARAGRFDTFLYQDQDDNAVTGQSLGIGDGATVNFQLVKNFGGFIEPVLAPNSVSNIYLNSSAQASSTWAVTGWGSTASGVLSFVTAPTSTQEITADFSYYFPVRFDENHLDFTKMMYALYSCKTIKFSSEKLGS